MVQPPHHPVEANLKENGGLGFVLSAFVYAVHDAVMLFWAGLDVEMPVFRSLSPRWEKLVRTWRGSETVLRGCFTHPGQTIVLSGLGEPTGTK